jgi:hypothetical protein
MTGSDEATDRAVRLRALMQRGAPPLALALVAVSILLALLLLAADQGPNHGARAWAHIRATKGACFLERQQSHNAVSCRRLRPGVYAITFAVSLRNSAPVVSRETCCLGEAGVTLSSDRDVTVAFGPERHFPILAFILLP